MARSLKNVILFNTFVVSIKNYEPQILQVKVVNILDIC